ncbi:chorismate mutase|uniref:chorismate mutase n=1 Tax=Brenneria salicis ATCC 15712 = DSM 30166 TaxID=714314 RepID=A0A366I3E0_9GAMM|nr:chorismate mutase [Brenneria salicis]NMN90926.1 chorismate mutase [Brenneria salicis ATCC 15712 = DSM 30166]RBP60542.1 chorismate mutase [Brenneria salicis ATCC 15712 = DSM 30166]
MIKGDSHLSHYLQYLLKPHILCWAVFSFWALTAQAGKNEKIAQLIDQRLDYMKDVAGYKAENHLPIEDLPQERKVIEKSLVETESLGLEGESVRNFMIAQISVAKTIQYRYRADWLSVPEKNWKPRDLADIRQRISALSDATIRQIADELKNKRGVKVDYCSSIQTMQRHNLKTSDKEMLCLALNQITLK